MNFLGLHQDRLDGECKYRNCNIFGMKSCHFIVLCMPDKIAFVKFSDVLECPENNYLLVGLFCK